nr:zinc finger, CCHC-type [Tanacetum cinerariifolium]
MLPNLTPIKDGDSAEHDISDDAICNVNQFHIKICIVKNALVFVIVALSTAPAVSAQATTPAPSPNAGSTFSVSISGVMIGDYSKPSHEGYKNTIKLPKGNNVVPLRSDTIRLVQNRSSFYRLWSEDPNQHLKDFLKLVDSLDLDGENRERTRLRLFQFSLRDQASNWLERLPAGSISTWEDLTTRFLAQFFPLRRTAKLRNDCLMFQKHHGESLSEAWTRFKDLLQKVPHHGIDLWLQLRDLNPEESWAILEDLAFYDNESWNDPKDFAKPVKAIALPQDVPSTSDYQSLLRVKSAVVPTTLSIAWKILNKPSLNTHPRIPMKRKQSEMTNKIDTVLKAITDRIAGTLPSDIVKNPKLGTHPVSSARSYPTMDPQCSTQIHSSINAIMIHPKLQSDSRYDRTKQNEEEKRDSPESHSNSSTPPDPSISFLFEKVLKFNSLFESLGLVMWSLLGLLRSFIAQEEDGNVMFIEIIPKDDYSCKEEPKAEGQEVEYSDIIPTRSELAYHKYLMCGPIPLIFLRNPIITGGFPSNLKIPCNIGHVHVKKSYFDLNSPLNIMTRMTYNWIMRRKLNPREDANGGISNFTRRIKRMHVFIGNFTYIIDFMISRILV